MLVRRAYPSDNAVAAFASDVGTAALRVGFVVGVQAGEIAGHVGAATFALPEILVALVIRKWVPSRVDEGDESCARPRYGDCCRRLPLEALGFRNVSHYLGGVSDWAAAGLPVEGHLAEEPTIGSLASRDVTTCQLDDRVDAILDRMGREAYAACFVLNDDGVVLGRYRSDLRAGRGPAAIDAMRPGPSTYRPDVTAREMLTRMLEHNLHTAPVTTSDGRLVGLVRRRDLRPQARTPS